MSNEWDDHADGWDSNEQVIQYANMAFNEIGRISNFEKKRFLDFGCGTGLLTELMSAKAGEIIALDPSKEMIAVLNQKQLPNVEAVSAFLTKELVQTHPAFSQPFDLIVASSVCAFLPNYTEVLKILKSVLKQDGVIIQWDWLVPEDNMEMGLSKNEITRAYRDAGLQLTELSEPFEIKADDDVMPVIMATGQNYPELPTIRTKRLKMSQLTKEDWPIISFLRSDPTVNTYVQRPSAETEGKATDFIAKINQGIEDHQWYYWKITDQDSDEMMGTICIWHFSEDRKTAEVGYDLHPDYQGKGFMTEALNAICDFGFETLELNAIDAYTHRQNESSKRLLEKHGFQIVEGKIDLENENNIVYQLSRR